MATLHPPNILDFKQRQDPPRSQGTDDAWTFFPSTTEPHIKRKPATPASPVSLSHHYTQRSAAHCRTGIFVRDPPRAALFDLHAESVTGDASCLTNLYSPSAFDEVTSDAYLSNLYLANNAIPSLFEPLPTMARKRRSLQSILVPSFLHSPPPSTLPSPTAPSSRARSLSYGSPLLSSHSIASSSRQSRASSSTSPPPDLLDDDPFANLNVRQVSSTQSESSPPRPAASAPATPRSPLSPSRTDLVSRLSAHTTIQSSPPSMEVFPRPQLVRPAHKKPAFAPRPSLPSLHTLAQMHVNVVLPRKVRKGRVGARLPFEPWNMQHEVSNAAGDGRENTPPSQPAPVDFTSDLDMDFLDFSDDSDEEPSFDDDIPTSDQDDDTLTLSQASEVIATTPNDDSHIPSYSPVPTRPSSPQALVTSAWQSSSEELGIDEDIISPDLRRDTSRRSNNSQDSGQASFQSSSSDSDVPNSPPDDYFTFPRRPTHPFDLDFEDDIDCPDLEQGPSNPRSIYYNRDDEFQAPDASFQPGSSSGTIRGSFIQMLARDHSRRPANQWLDDDEDMVDGSDWQGGRNEYHYTSSRNGGGGGGGGGDRSFGRYPNGGGGRGPSKWGGNGGDDGDDGDDRRYRKRSAYPTSSSASTDTEESDSEDDYGLPSAVEPPAPTAGTADDDDVPLAQRIPTALRAQKTIRRQFREEREQRRKDRAQRAQRTERTQSQPPRERHTTLRPKGAGENLPPILSSSQEAALLAAQAEWRARGPSPGPERPSTEGRPFTVEELTRKLQNFQTQETRPRSKSTTRPPSSSGREADKDRAPAGMHDSVLRVSDPARTLRPMRSFHRPAQPAVDYSAPMPATSKKLGRSATDARSRHREEKQGPDVNMSEFDRLVKARRSADTQAAPPAPQQHLSVARTSGEARSARTSLDNPTSPRPSFPRSPNAPPAALSSRVELTQQRVFIGDMQRFNTVEIGPGTTAKDILIMVEAQGTLKQFIGSGGWMVYEVAQDFGMERPIRSFEVISDIQASWNSDKLVNTFVLKLTPLARLLSRSAIPPSSPMFSGWVEYEYKRGKWAKRWMMLREHSLWLSKRDSGKDEVFLCSLSNFDAYYVTRVHKAPKPFVFAIKSTDNLSFFESTDDYMHLFSCNQPAGEKWMEVILLARSYVLYQDKNVLYNPKATSLTSGPSLTRAGTRRNPRSTQPLVNVAPQEMFEPGSLLYKKS
ncbi:hypothetical protein HGRIS_006006 [Hohenbuehelia grisea]|uniref:PH domain-containing protein n=1 Tax=Hohenbuehelia grisea TaxID=104357 RepID=A0ABR3JZG8_9AGAR